MSGDDSTADTLEHIACVQERIEEVRDLLAERALVHDASKFREPEKSGFDVIRPRLDHDDVDSDDYRATLNEFEATLRHHYDHNRHHPEWGREHGVEGWAENNLVAMTLIDLVEMLCDWAAASQRTPGGKVNVDWAVERFGIEPQLERILRNTVQEMEW